MKLKQTNKKQRINETKSSFFEKINKIDRRPANLTKMRKEKNQTSKIRNAKGERTTNTTEIQEFIRDYFDSLYFEEMKSSRNLQPPKTKPRGY
jgi:hypothetical protein